MKVYFDKDNLVSFVNSKPSEETSFCKDLLKRKCKILFTFPKNEVIDDERLKMWLTTLSDGLRKDISWNVGQLIRPLKAHNIINEGMDALQSVYLLNDESVNDLKSKGIVLVGGIGEEVKVLSSLWFDDMQYIKDIFDKVNKWDDIIPYMSPTSDILIIDNFLMHHEELISYNLLKILMVLCSQSNQQKLSIVIFVEKDDNRLRDYYENLKQEIESKVKSIVSTSPNVAIVAAPKTQIGEHDRTILTNYKMFVSGDSWNYFNGKGEKITKGRHLTVHSLVDDDIKNKADRLISDMRIVFNQILHNNKNCIYMKSKFKSNILAYSNQN